MQIKPIPDHITSQGASDTFLARFFSKINYTDTCWLWTGHIMSHGYGCMGKGSSRRKESRSILAHRASWLIHFGLIPKGMFVCHECDVRHCVNPAHLWMGVHQDNMDDMMRKGREAHNFGMFAGERSYMAKLSWNEVQSIRNIYDSGNVTQEELASRFNVVRSVICGILTNKIWIDPDYKRPYKSRKILSQCEREEIKHRYANEDISQQVLAELFGVSQVCISLVVKSKH